MKMYPQLTREYIRDGISYANLVLLQSVIPPYRSKDIKGGKGFKESKGFKDSNWKPEKHIDEFLFG